jgi:hypothetical protein
VTTKFEELTNRREKGSLAREWSLEVLSEEVWLKGLLEEVISGHKGFAGGDSQEEVCLAVVSGPNRLMLVFQRKGKERRRREREIRG